ncbi:MAG: patatin-like phospholipase family protein [Hydrogenimonas sp.]|nr:patatin-like phospholipase family protein [Hydrogenimonas sp.]
MKISLALSGGGIRAAAHLGVVKVLQENGFEIAAISGSSGGAIVGALLCDKKRPEDILKLIKTLKLKDLAGPSGAGGVFGLGKLEKILQENLESKRIEDLPVPFTVACTDLSGGSVLYFDEGPLSKLTIASSSLVPIFSPVKHEGMLLADGGFMDNLPAKPLKRYGYPIVGINVNPIPQKEPSGLLSATIRVLMLMMGANIKASREFVDFYIEPSGCGEINIFDLKKADTAYEEGVRSAQNSLADLISAMEHKDKKN